MGLPVTNWIITGMQQAVEGSRLHTMQLVSVIITNIAAGQHLPCMWPHKMGVPATHGACMLRPGAYRCAFSWPWWQHGSYRMCSGPFACLSLCIEEHMCGMLEECKPLGFIVLGLETPCGVSQARGSCQSEGVEADLRFVMRPYVGCGPDFHPSAMVRPCA